MELAVYDFNALNSAPNTPDQRIVIVDIDDESINQLGVWPWPREYHAKVIKRLTQLGAKIVCLDVLLSTVSNASVAEESGKNKPLDWEPPPGKSDLALEAAMKECGNVIVAAASAKKNVQSGDVGGDISEILFPYWRFEDAALAVGSVDLTADVDGSIRSCTLSRVYQDERLYTMPIAIAAEYTRQSPSDVCKRINTDIGRKATEDGDFLISYRGQPGLGFNRIPYYQVLRGGMTKFLSSAVKDKIVIIGASASALQDEHNTPVSNRGSSQQVGGRQMPGVEILASAADTILTSNFIRPASNSLVTALAVLLTVIVVVAGIWMRPLWALLAAWLPGQLIAFLTVLSAWQNHDIWISIVPLSLGITLGYISTVVYRELTTERRRRGLQQAWSRRVSPEVMQVILNNPSLANVKGRRVTATALFTDLEGFTTYCHENPPEVVVASLNEVLSMITKVIRQYGGTVHKFIGDGVFAAFGDPVVQEDHARRAVQAACAIQRAMSQLAKSHPGGECWNPNLRIGIHTGEMVAGDIGSEDLLEYTLIGDAVSTASRLEALNKKYGTKVLISKATADAVGPDIHMTSLGLAEIRGHAEPMEVFSVDPEISDAQIGRES
jgi:adenylate cyclase